MYGGTYKCDHPVYNRCTLFQIGNDGLAVIQQRFNKRTKTTYWSEIDPWLTDDIYLHPKFKESFWRIRKWTISHSNGKTTNAVFEVKTYS